MSKFLFDSMLPKYSQFQSLISSQISSQTPTVSQTPNSEGSPLTSSEGSPSSPPTSKMYPYVSNHPSSHTSLSGMPGFSGLDDKSCRWVTVKLVPKLFCRRLWLPPVFFRYTESMMNTYQSMGVPPSASSFAQFYQAASAVSAASAGAIGVGVDSLGNACTQPSSGVVSTGGTGQTITDIPRYPWMTLTGSWNHFSITANIWMISLLNGNIFGRF